jgi:hypothetical protein
MPVNLPAQGSQLAPLATGSVAQPASSKGIKDNKAKTINFRFESGFCIFNLPSIQILPFRGGVSPCPSAAAVEIEPRPLVGRARTLRPPRVTHL